MVTTAGARLSDGERRLLERYAETLRAEFGVSLRAVWLFGSRARDEDTGPESDVDVLVLVDDDSWDNKERIRSRLHELAEEMSLDRVPWYFSVHVNTPEWLRRRREIRSFFIQDVDRDKIVVLGDA